MNLVVPLFFFRSSLSMEKYQLHPLHGQFILVETCSDMESSGGFVKAHKKKDQSNWWETFQIMSSFSLPLGHMRNGSSSLVFHKERASCTGDLYRNYVVERLLLLRGTHWESNGSAFIENAMLVQARLVCWHCCCCHKSVILHRSSTRFRDLQGVIKTLNDEYFAAVHST